MTKINELQLKVAQLEYENRELTMKNFMQKLDLDFFETFKWPDRFVAFTLGLFYITMILFIMGVIL